MKIGAWSGLLLCPLALASSQTVGAQTWVPIGPTGGDVRGLAQDPNAPGVVYLGTASGSMYRSDDAGGHWQRLTPGFPSPGMSLDSIVVDSRGRIDVGYWAVNGEGGGVARSTDGGHSFAALPGIQGHSVRALASSAAAPEVLVAGAIDGVFRSDDGGDSWRRISPEGQTGIHNVESLALDQRNNDVIYAGTWHLPWKTIDGGKTWHEMQAGMIEDSDVFTLTLDRRDPKIVFATACTGIYRSRDSASRWAKVPGIPAASRRTRSFAQGVEHADTLYAGTTVGLYLSEDDGQTWQLTTRGEVVVNAIAVLPRSSGGAVLLGTEGAGILKSTDGGHTFVSANDGFRERVFSRVLVAPQGNRIVLSAKGERSRGTVLQARGIDGPWQRVGDGLDGREVFAIALDGAEVVAGTDDGVFRSVSHCGLWSRLPTSIDGVETHPHVADLAVLPGGVILAATSDGVLLGEKEGSSWRRQTLGNARSVLALAVSGEGDPRVVLAETPLGTFRSTDLGETWVQVALGLADPDIEIHSMAFLPGSDTVVFAATRSGLLRSTDSGHVWKRCRGDLPFSDIAGLAFGSDGRTLYASDFTFGGLYKSPDMGTSWLRLPTSGLASDRVWALAVHPAGVDRILASAATGGLQLLAPAESSSGGDP